MLSFVLYTFIVMMMCIVIVVVVLVALFGRNAVYVQLDGLAYTPYSAAAAAHYAGHTSIIFNI